MNKLIFNEKTYIENLLSSHDKNNVNVTLPQLMWLVAVYIHQKYMCDDKRELAKMVNAEIESFNFDGYYYELYYKQIDNIANNVIKNNSKLKEVYSVPIYQSEYEIIKSCGDKKHQKLLATLYVMARWNDKDGWTSNKCKSPHMKKSANLNMTNKDFDYLFYDLISQGYIKTTVKAGLFCYQMLNYNEDKNEPIALELNSFDNIGNKFLSSKDNEHIVCSICGKLVKKTSPRMKYCKKCAENVIREKNTKLQQKKREKSRN